MNFDFSPDQKDVQEQARRLLTERCDLKSVRRIFEGADDYDRLLWGQVAELGWTGISIPEAYGGLGMGRGTLCVLATELGRALAPLPFCSSLFLGAEAVLQSDDEEIKETLLPGVASGETILTVAFDEDRGGKGDTRGTATAFADGTVSGTKVPVADGGAADHAVVSARDAHGLLGLYLIDLSGPGVSRREVETIDPSKPHASIRFDHSPARPLNTRGGGNPITRLMDIAAVYVAFEQLGGAEAALALSTDYAKLRHAFGRPIGSFQAIKHKLADMYVLIELARANCYYAAWALDEMNDELALAAATARVSATDAFDFAARETIQVHGGIGATWEADMHFFYRRSRQLGLMLGSQLHWRSRVVAQLERRAA